MAFTHPENVIINQAVPFTGRLVDVQLSGASKAYVDQDGNVFINGNVGIGTASPAAKLQVVGNIYLMDGSVGINTTNPQERLDVRQTGAGGTVGVRIGGDGASAASYLDIAASDALSNQMLWRLRPTSTAANQSRFDILNITQGQARISIDNAGNVGIGTATPTAKLDVAGTVLANVTDPLAYRFLNLGKTEGLVIDTTNKAVRPLTDNVYSLGAGAQRWGSLRVGTGDSSFAGNVGIGTQTPTAKLDVSGDIKASGNISSGVTGDLAISAGRRLYLNGLGGTRYLADNSVQNCIDVAGNLTVGGGFQPEPTTDIGLSIDDEGTLKTNGNLQVLRTDPSGTPVVWHLGRQGMVSVPNPPPNPPTVIPARTNYFFWQDRPNREGWYWSGWNTFRAPGTLKNGPNSPETVPWGYGYYPFRNMAKNYLLEASGEIVTDFRFYGPIIYFQKPLHLDLNPETPPPPGELPLVSNAQYTSDIRPFKDLLVQTTLVSTGPSQITVVSPGGFAADDEIFIGTVNNSEINEIASIIGNTFNLKRDIKTYAGGEPVKKIRELGGVQPDRGTSGLAIYIKLNGNDLVFKDSVGEITLNYIRQHLLP